MAKKILKDKLDNINSILGRYNSTINDALAKWKKLTTFSTGYCSNYALTKWKNKFIEMEGFDPRYGYADDQTFFLKYGIKPEIARGAVCYHDNPETLKEVYKQSRWIGASGRYKWLDIPVLNLLIIFLMYPLSFVAIPILALKRCYKDKLRSKRFQ